jgi:IS5 family transposase
MERKGMQPMLLDGITADLGGPRMAAFFDKCNRLIPWQQLANSLTGLFDDSQPAKGGRPHYPVVLILKCMMLQKWFNLSDPGLEETLMDRLSFRRFVGLSVRDVTPDETSFVQWRKRLRHSGHIQTLFDRTVQCLRDQGLLLQEGTLVDATIIEVPRGRKRPDGSVTTDPTATKTFKHGRPYHGHKVHVATDKRGIIKDYVFDTASSSDHDHADHLMKDETKAVYADSGYMSKKRKAELEARGVFCGIIHRRVKGQAELTAEQQAHNRLCAPIRAIVEHPFGWMRKMGRWRGRYRGLIRNAVDFALMAVAYNWKRSFSLAPVAAAMGG